MLQRLINRIKTTIWLYPAIYSLFALALATFVARLDQYYSNTLAQRISGLFYTSPALATNVLGIIAGAFITIATFTFSTAMVVLTMYSSQFTPRVMENFLNNDTTMKSFGVFLSGFIYAITSLLMIPSSQENGRVLAASIGVLYIIVGLVYFLIFINNVSTHIQANGLILRLQKVAEDRIGIYHQKMNGSELLSNLQLKEMIHHKNELQIFSPADGYLQEIDYERLVELAQKSESLIVLSKIIGQFVSVESQILSIYHEEKQTIDEEMIQQIQGCVFVGNKRVEAYDFAFTLQKIVEIALKALSPGINDPNTAIHCLNILGLLLRDLADINQGFAILNQAEAKEEKSEGSQGRLIYEEYDFSILLFDSFNQIAHYGQEDALVMIALFKSLRSAKARATEENIEVIETYAAHLLETLKEKPFHSWEHIKIDKEYRELVSFRKLIKRAQPQGADQKE